MKINRISYNNSNTDLIDRWIEHIIESSIIDHLACSISEELNLRSIKYISET